MLFVCFAVELKKSDTTIRFVRTEYHRDKTVKETIGTFTPQSGGAFAIVLTGTITTIHGMTEESLEGVPCSSVRRSNFTAPEHQSGQIMSVSGGRVVIRIGTTIYAPAAH